MNFFVPILKDSVFNIDDIYNAQLPDNYKNSHRPSSVMLEKAELEKFQQISACYDKYESILGQVCMKSTNISMTYEVFMMSYIDSSWNVQVLPSWSI